LVILKVGELLRAKQAKRPVAVPPA